MLKNKRGQLTLADAPTVVLLVGLVFLIMATMAFIGAKYGDALLASEKITTTVTNESDFTGPVVFANRTGFTVAGATAFRVENFVVTSVFNSSSQGAGNGGYNITVPTTNVSLSSLGVLNNATNAEYTNISLSYTYNTFTRTSAFNTTEDLNTEIANNTSIAGIVLTISLVGIVLTVLIGVFLVTRGAGAGRA